MALVLTNSASATTVYEDAESGNTNAWRVVDANPTGASISTAFDTDRNSGVIHFSGTQTKNSFLIGATGNNSAKSWKNTAESFISFDMKFSQTYRIFISVETSNGQRFIKYSPGKNISISNNSKFINIGLGSGTLNGNWRNVVRDLQADIHQLEPNNTLLQVNGLLLRGSGSLDNISLSSQGVLENADDQGTLGWQVVDQSPAGAYVANLFVASKQDRVIEFAGDGTRNSYRLGGNSGGFGDWNHFGTPTISWSMKFNQDFIIYIMANTTAGKRSFVYRNRNSAPKRVVKTTQNLLYFGLGLNSANATWQTFTRDLSADLAQLEPSNQILSVSGMTVRGSGLIDDIILAGQSSAGSFNASDAARFLNQATFGANRTAIDEALALGSRSAWIDSQIGADPAQRSLIKPFVVSLGSTSNQYARDYPWMKNTLEGADQLRQRMAFALSEIFVVSDRNYTVGTGGQYGVADYYDTFSEYAFGNFRDLIDEISRHAIMGIYLSSVGNEKANTTSNRRPDENFAREVLQLFSIGLNQLNMDGTVIADNSGKACPTFDNQLVTEFARVFTGWHFANLGTGNWVPNDYTSFDKESPMVGYHSHHDQGAKTLLNTSTALTSTGCRDIDNGSYVPADSSSNSTENDLDAALDNIFNHPNVPPFIARLLIQRFTTSNPSPAYIGRVASVFADNGNSVRGDLGAVIKAILTDDEAVRGIQANPDFGKIREPIVLLTQLWRAVDIVEGAYADPSEDSYEFRYKTNYMNSAYFEDVLGQAYLRSPSVFNFFSPDTPLAKVNSQLLSPESHLHTEGYLSLQLADLHFQIYYANTHEIPGPYHYTLRLSFDDLVTMASTPATLVEHLNLVLLGGQMDPGLRTSLTALIASHPATQAGFVEAIKETLYVITASPAYRVQL